MHNENKYGLRENWLLIAGLFLMYAIMLPRDHMQLDFEYWTNWAIYIHEHGVLNVYNNPFMVDYHPIYLYILGAFGAIQGSTTDIAVNINSIKLVPLFFDFLPIVVLCGFRQQFIKRDIPFLFLLLNIAYMYNSMIWGQIDSVYVNLIFLAVVVGFTRPYLSAALFALSLGTKLQAIVYLPLLFLVWLYAANGIKTFIGIIATLAVVLGVIALPFILAGNGDKLLHVVTSAVGRYPQVSITGFNIWYLIYNGNPNHTVDTETYFILSFKTWGFLLFFGLSGYTLLVALLHTIKEKLSSNREALMQMLLLTGALITLYFYYFNTQMHERYAHAMIIFLFFYGVLSKNYKLYILASIPYFLSLEKVFPNYLPIAHPKILFASKVIAILYTITIGYAMYEFFKQYKLKDGIAAVRPMLNKTTQK